MDEDMFQLYHDFVVGRHRIWEKRQFGAEPPWTDNPVLRSHKYTNVFRILDPGTQFVMTDLINPELSPEDQLYRLFLYRHTGRIEAWQFFQLMTGDYPVVGQGELVREMFKQYRTVANSVFTNAYLVFPQSQTPGTDKLDSIVDLADRIFFGSTGARFADEVYPERQFRLLQSQPGVGNFMAMQILTDWGYTPHCGEDRENSFIVPGPGAEKGAQLIRPRAGAHANATDLIYKLQEEWQLDLDCPSLDGRYPSLMDVQNTLCEFSKYARHLNKDARADYKVQHPGPQPTPVLPEHWRH